MSEIHIGDLYLDGTDVVVVTDILEKGYRTFNQFGIESTRDLINTTLIMSYTDIIKQFEVKLCGEEI